MRQTKTKKANQIRTAKIDTYHHGDLKSALIDAAIQLLKRMTPAELSLRELARQAGVSAAAPYRHFKDKNELLAAISEQGYELKYQYMLKAIRSAKGNPLEIYYACGLAYFHMGLNHPQHFKLMISSEIIPSEEHPQLMKTAVKSFMLLKCMIEHSQKQKITGAGNPFHKAMNCWCVVNGFTSLYVEGRLAWLGLNKENAEAALRVLLSQFLNGTKDAIQSPQFTPFSDAGADLSKLAVMNETVSKVEKTFAEMLTP